MVAVATGRKKGHRDGSRAKGISACTVVHVNASMMLMFRLAVFHTAPHSSARRFLRSEPFPPRAELRASYRSHPEGGFTLINVGPSGDLTVRCP